MTFFLWMVGAVALGFIIGTTLGRVDRSADESIIAALREALVRTQNALTEANAVKDEAVAAQEVAERTLKEQFERRSEAGKKAWQTRKAHAA